MKKVVNKNKNMIGAVVLAMIAMAILLNGCTSAEPAAPAAPAAQVPAASAAAPTTMLSGVACASGDIEGTILNVMGQQVEVSSLRILLNGEVVDAMMLKCDKDVLQPGEFTKCQSLNGVLPAVGENKLAVVMGSETVQESIDCPAGLA